MSGRTSTEKAEKVSEHVVIAQSKDDLFLRQLMAESEKGEPEAWYGQVQVDEQFKSMFLLPEELREGHPKQHTDSKTRAYCWVEVSDQRVANLYRQMKWVPVNRTNHAFLPRSYFDVNGAIRREGYSVHILMYQPRAYNEAVKEAAGKKHEDRKKDAQSRLENLSGGVHVEHQEISLSGGYGNTPVDAPIQLDIDGSDLKGADAFEYVED